MATTMNVRIEPLTREAYAPYGDVIDMEDVDHFSINEGGRTLSKHRAL